jgi:hypothetical protein
MNVEITLLMMREDFLIQTITLTQPESAFLLWFRVTVKARSAGQILLPFAVQRQLKARFSEFKEQKC